MVCLRHKTGSHGVAQRISFSKLSIDRAAIRTIARKTHPDQARRRERQMQQFKSPGQAQDFLPAHAFIHGHFHPRRHLLTATAYRAIHALRPSTSGGMRHPLRALRNQHKIFAWLTKSRWREVNVFMALRAGHFAGGSVSWGDFCRNGYQEQLRQTRDRPHWRVQLSPIMQGARETAKLATTYDRKASWRAQMPAQDSIDKIVGDLRARLAVICSVSCSLRRPLCHVFAFLGLTIPAVPRAVIDLAGSVDPDLTSRSGGRHRGCLCR